jgi:hypothetical protein
MREPIALSCYRLEISQVSNYKTSITLRVQICRRHKVRHKNCCKYTKKSERQSGFVVFLTKNLHLDLYNRKKVYFCSRLNQQLND